MQAVINPYACAFCAESFSAASCLVKHVNTKHQNSEIKKERKESDTKIQITDKHYGLQNPSNDHSQEKDEKQSDIIEDDERKNPTKKIYACNFCQKKFNASFSKKVHERIHTSEKPYSCRFCDKKFTQKGHKMAHEVIHTGEKLYQCKFCSKKFAFNFK